MNNTLAPQRPAISSAFPGAHITSPDSYSVVTNDFATPEVDRDLISHVAELPDADQRVEAHHRARFDADTEGRIHGVRMIRDRDADFVAVGLAECARLKTHLEAIGGEYFPVPGGNQPRTWGTWVRFTCLLVVFLCILPVEFLFLRYIVGEVAPELLASWSFMAPFAALPLLAITALKSSLTLAAQDEASYRARCAFWSRLLPWAAIPLGLALAWRYLELSSNPTVSLLETGNSWHEPAGLAVFFVQIAAQAVVATGALLAAEHTLWLTRPAKHLLKPEYAAAKAALEKETQLLDGNRDRLGLAEQKLAAISAELDLLLHRAAAALEDERRERRAIQLEIQALRRSHN